MKPCLKTPSRAFSSSGMNTTLSNMKKATVIIKGIMLPKRTAPPRRIITIPRYMGFLLKVKGPSSIRKLDFSNGLTVVFFCLNKRSAQIFNHIPAPMNKMPV